MLTAKRIEALYRTTRELQERSEVKRLRVPEGPRQRRLKRLSTRKSTFRRAGQCLDSPPGWVDTVGQAALRPRSLGEASARLLTGARSRREAKLKFCGDFSVLDRAGGRKSLVITFFQRTLRFVAKRFTAWEGNAVPPKLVHNERL